MSAPVTVPADRAAPSPDALLIARSLRNAVLVALLLLALWLTITVDLVIFAGVLLAICLRGAAEWLSRRAGIGEGWMLAAIVLLIMAALAAVGWFFSQSIASQIDQLSEKLPAAISKVATSFRESNIGRILSEHLGNAPLKTSPAGLVQGFFGVASNAFEVIGGLVVIGFLGIYLAAETKLYTGGLLRLVPPHHRPRAATILGATAHAVRYWIMGRLVAMVTLGVLTALGLWALGVPLPGALGFLAGLMVFVPYIGSVAAAVPAVLLAASVKLGLALSVIGLYIVIHLIEGYILVPLVQRRVVHLPPALILSAQLILGVIAGFLGLLFATPLVAIGLVLMRMIYVEGILGDRAATASREPDHPASP